MQNIPPKLITLGTRKEISFVMFRFLNDALDGSVGCPFILTSRVHSQQALRLSVSA